MDSWRAVSIPPLPGRGPEPYVHDTATGELVQAAAGPTATMYACGITPYDATHIGHAATFLAWDLLVRAWHDAGHNVIYVQNVTDVDDPLLERAARDAEDWRDLADREIARYRGDMEALRVLPPARLVGAVEALPVIEQLSRRLAERGSLYDLEGDLYFSRASDPEFGSVSRLDPATMAVLFAERGGDPARPGKKDPLDALVWLAARPGEPSWASSFGPGRPGWHVECAAIATEYLSRVFDVQAGGTDLIFPHHEMSASHARVALGDGLHARGEAGCARSPAITCTRAWCGLDGEKMSKSLGNLVFVSSLLATRHRPDGDPAGHPRPPLPPTTGTGRRPGWRRPSSGSPAGGPPWTGCWHLHRSRSGRARRTRRPSPARRTRRPSPACRTRRPSPARWRRRRRCWPPCASGWPTTWTRRGRSPRSTGWAEEVTGALVLPPDARAAALLVRDAVDALLGVGL